MSTLSHLSTDPLSYFFSKNNGKNIIKEMILLQIHLVIDFRILTNYAKKMRKMVDKKIHLLILLFIIFQFSSNPGRQKKEHQFDAQFYII